MIKYKTCGDCTYFPISCYGNVEGYCYKYTEALPSQREFISNYITPFEKSTKKE